MRLLYRNTPKFLQGHIPPFAFGFAALIASLLALLSLPRAAAAQEQPAASLPPVPENNGIATAINTGNNNSEVPLQGDALAPGALNADDFWPQWRGPRNSGASPNGTPPVQWSEIENILWKIEIPGQGTASPIVWGDRVFVLTAINTGKKAPSTATSKSDGEDTEATRTKPRLPGFGPGRRFRSGGSRGEGFFPGRPSWMFGSNVPTETHQFVILCFSRRDGTLLWKDVTTETVPHEAHHQNHGFASASPVTDGEHVYAHFGSRGIFCYTLNGDRVWHQDPGDMLTRRSYGEGSSPALAGDALILNWDHEGQSFIISFDKRTGEILWKVERDEATTWSTPLVVEHQQSQQIITNGHTAVRSYDPANGDLLWFAGGQTERPIASPVAGLGYVYVASGYRGSNLSAIELGHQGDLNGTNAIAWEITDNTPDIPSLLLSGERLYFMARNSGLVSCHSAVTGDPFFGPSRIGLYDVYASPIAANGHIYITGRNGVTVVLEDSGQLEIVATNTLNAAIDASPAIAGNHLFLRSKTHLYCIGPPDSPGKNPAPTPPSSTNRFPARRRRSTARPTPASTPQGLRPRLHPAPAPAMPPTSRLRPSPGSPRVLSRKSHHCTTIILPHADTLGQRWRVALRRNRPGGNDTASVRSASFPAEGIPQSPAKRG